MWVFRNSDVVVNGFLNIEPEHRIRSIVRFSAFVLGASRGHPCHMPSSVPTTKMRAVDEDVYVLHLLNHWWVTYRVLPDCSAAEGIVRFVTMGKMMQAI
jgi:hypothetical protein